MPNRSSNKKLSPKKASVNDPSNKKKERRNLENTINEKDILLSLNNDIASVKDKKDILKIIHPKLKTLFNTDDIFICCLDAKNETLNPIVRVAGKKRNSHPEYENILNSHLPIHDGFIDTILNAKEPLVFDIDKVNKLPNPPGYMKISKATGLAETLSTPLYHGGELLGILTFWSEKKNSFTDHHKQLIAKIADHISIVIINILAYEAIKKNETENEILLLLGNKIASIRNKEDLSHILSTTLKANINFDDCAVIVYNKARNVYNIYSYYVAKKRLENPLFKQVILAEYPLSDNNLSNPHTPVVVDMDKMLKSENSAVSFIRDTGIKELAIIKLVDGNDLIGLFVLLSEQIKSFTQSDLHIMQRVSYQISIAVAKLLSNEEIERRESEKSLLLSISNDMALVRGHEDLAKIINQKLKKLFFIQDYTIVALHENKLTYGSYLYDQEDTPYDKKREYLETLFNSFKFEEGLYDVVLRSDEPVVFDIDEIMKRKVVPGHIKFFNSLGIREIVGTTLKIGNDAIGILWIQPEKANCFDTVNQHVFKAVCSQISIALANIIANEDIQRRKEEKEVLLLLSNDIASIRSRKDLLGVITKQLKKLFNYNDASIIILNKENQTYSAFVLDMEERRTNHEECLPNSLGIYPIADGICDAILHAGKPIILNYAEVLKNPSAPSWAFFLHQTGINEMVSVVLREGNEDIGAFFLHSETENYFHEYQLNLIQGIGYQLSVALANVLANEKIAAQLEEINHYKSQLEEENIYLQQQIESAYNYSEIIGSGPAIQKVFHLISQVSFANSTVLILGETGTGKELIARAIHNASPRKDRLMVKVNCAALPPNLIESELFGHERGSFTGATDRRIGKFELANHSTLFLDEIGELSPEIQVKLLRALQEKEIERIGGKTTIKVDVRIITATNRNLQKEVDEGNFRTDLFYRLNVFPITLPPLRNRKEDIPALAEYFVAKYSRIAGKKIRSLSKKVMKELMGYSWPGNVRELEHLIERTVLITEFDVIKEIHLPVLEQSKIKNKEENLYTKTIQENEREYILEVLKRCEGRIFGKNGAAEVLGVPVSTLNSKIKKLGIKKEKMFTNTAK